MLTSADKKNLAIIWDLDKTTQWTLRMEAKERKLSANNQTLFEESGGLWLENYAPKDRTVVGATSGGLASTSASGDPPLHRKHT